MPFSSFSGHIEYLKWLQSSHRPSKFNWHQKKIFPHLSGTLGSRLEYDRDKKMRKLVQTFNKVDSLMSGRVTFYYMTVSLTQKLLNQVLGGAVVYIDVEKESREREAFWADDAENRARKKKRRRKFVNENKLSYNDFRCCVPLSSVCFC